jgi:regulator of protease activity HflC (stomatin/prohibitin superfamily)
MTREIVRRAQPGIPFIGVVLLTLGGAGWLFYTGAQAHAALPAALGVALLVVASIAMGGFVSIEPNDARVLTLFGDYKGSLKAPGLWWVNPFMQKKKVTQRVRNFETTKLKVNDKNSNPIEIAAIVVWRIIDTAEATFEVENVEHYVKVQGEAALRALASHYPYDAHAPNEVALATHQEEVSHELMQELIARFAKAGVEVLESRVSHLAYAPEIAAVMLQRQQAAAVVAARQTIVEGAVGMVDMALEMLETRNMAQLDNERRAAMISNLLVVLCGDRGTQPVVNTGSLYT